MRTLKSLMDSCLKRIGLTSSLLAAEFNPAFTEAELEHSRIACTAHQPIRHSEAQP
jgi:hypothetical protein